MAALMPVSDARRNVLDGATGLPEELVPLDQVAGRTRHMPDSFFDSANTISDEGRRYFRRLLPPRPDIFTPFV